MQRNAIIALAICAGAFAAWMGITPALAADPAKPPVVVVGVNANKVAFSNVLQPDVKIPLTIENTSTQTLDKVSIQLSPFTAPTADSVSATIEPATAKLLPGETAQFNLKAQFFPAATFSAHARVLQETKVLTSFDIEIGRTKAKPQMDIGDIAPIEETARVPRADLDIPLTVKVLATGASVVVPQPVLQSAIRKPKVDSAAGTAAAVSLDASSLKDPFVVKAGEPRDIALHLKGISSPGRYDVKLRFAPSGYDVIDKDVTIYVRDPGWIAAAFIFVGVVLSLVFQGYGGTIRPRLLLQRRVESIFAALRDLENSAPENDTRQRTAQVREALEQQWNRARDRGGLPATTVDLYEQMIPGLQRWSDMRHLVAATRPEAVRQRLLVRLQTAAGAFVAAVPDAAAITAALNTLQNFPDTIRTETVQELTTQLDLLDTQLRTDARPAVARLRSALLLVKQKVSAGDLNAAVGAFDAVRLQYAVLLAEDLINRVQSSVPPIGIAQDDWDSLAAETKRTAAEVQASTDADIAMLKVALAMKNYLFRVAGALRKAAGNLGSSEKVKTVTDELDAVDTAIQGNQLTAAWQRMNSATAAFQKASVPVGRAMGGPVKPASDLLGVAAGAFDIMGASGGFALPSAADLSRPGSPARTSRRLNWFDFLASAFALILATVIGLQALWIDNPVWGGGGLYLAAFVWGFAVDQLTHSGIVALRPR
ncbi:MAG TPA: hypothetical protein VII23_10335 [Terriglobales bacterium]